jgi:hypothetical protein
VLHVEAQLEEQISVPVLRMAFRADMTTEQLLRLDFQTV